MKNPIILRTNGVVSALSHDTSHQISNNNTTAYNNINHGQGDVLLSPKSMTS